MASSCKHSFGTRLKFYEGLIQALVEFAKFNFYWGSKHDGATVKEHVDIAKNSPLASLVIQDQTFADTPTEVFCPVEVEYIWQWFRELDETRDNSMAVGAITHQEITAWSDGMSLCITPFERQALRAIDRVYVNHVNSKTKK